MTDHRRDDLDRITGGTLGIIAVNRILVAGLYSKDLPENLQWLAEPDFRRNLHEVIEIITSELLDASEGPFV